MRHVLALIAAVLVAPLAWVLLAYGQDRSVAAFPEQAAVDGAGTADLVGPALCLAAAGLLLALLGFRQLSPMGAVLTGLAYTVSYLALLADPEGVLNLLPGAVSVAGQEADLATPLRTGSAMALGAALLLAAAITARRHQRAVPVEAGGGQLGADWLPPATPARDLLPGAQPFREDELVPGGGPEWTRVPVLPGWSTHDDDGPPAARGRGRWEELARDPGPESRRWPTVG